MKPKRAIYFPHHAGSRDTERLARVRMTHGAAGYGIYWMLIERLCEEPSHVCAKDYNLLSFDLRAKAETIRSVVEDFGLFDQTADGTAFYSANLTERMETIERTSRRRAEAALKRWGMDSDANASQDMQLHGETYAIASESDTKARTTHANASQDGQDVCNCIPEHAFASPTVCNCIPRDEEKESNKEKEEEKKEKPPKGGKKKAAVVAAFCPPTVEEVEAYARQMGYAEFNAAKFCAFYDSKGWMVGRNEMRDWRAAARGWEMRDRELGRRAAPPTQSVAPAAYMERIEVEMRAVNDRWEQRRAKAITYEEYLRRKKEAATNKQTE